MDPYINRDVHFPVLREQNIQQMCWNLGDFLFSQIEVRRIDERLCWTHRKHNGGESHIMQIPSAARIIVPEDSVFAMALCKAYAKRFQLRVLSRTDRSKSSFVHFQRYCRRRSFGQSNIILATPTLYIDELNHISMCPVFAKRCSLFVGASYFDVAVYVRSSGSSCVVCKV